MWLSANGRSILVTADTDLSQPSAELLEALRTEGLLDKRSDVYGATVMTTTRCNLTCSYCYQNESALGPTPVRIPQRAMRPEMIDEVCSFITGQMARYGKAAVHLLLTGGEPLLQFRACEQILLRLGPLGLTAAQMFTNGVLLNAERASTLKQAGLTHVQISFDGNREDHDRYRRDTAGEGSFDRILRNLATALDAAPGLRVTARVNVSARNIDKLPEFLDSLAREIGVDTVSLRFGLLDDIGIGFSDAPERNAGTGAKIRSLAVEGVDRGFQVEPLATTENCLYCGVVGGGSGCVINADGALYSCWESVGRDGLEVGSVQSGYLPHEVLAPRWVDCSYNVVGGESSRDVIRQICDNVDAAVLDRQFEQAVAARALA